MNNLKYMETRNITVTLEKAKEWYNSGDATLKEVALQAFDKNELSYNFKNITTFKKACKALGLAYDVTLVRVKNISTVSKASAAMFKLNIIKKAINLGKDLHLTKNPKDSNIYFPRILFMPVSLAHYKSTINLSENNLDKKILGEIKSEGEEYYVFSDDTDCSCYSGLGSFNTITGGVNNSSGFLGCASKEIAQHFGKHFGMLITEAKYGDMIDFEIISDHYQKRSCISTK